MKKYTGNEYCSQSWELSTQRLINANFAWLWLTIVHNLISKMPVLYIYKYYIYALAEPPFLRGMQKSFK